MTSSATTLDLPYDVVRVQERRKKRKIVIPRLEHVWIAYHQLEGTHDISFEYNYSHDPTVFDKTILGIFITEKAAKRCAYEECVSLGLLDEEDEDDDEEVDIDEICADIDFEGDGIFRDGSDYDRNTFSERIHIKKEDIDEE